MDTVCLPNLGRKITCQVMLLSFMPVKEFSTLNIYFIFQEVLKRRNCNFGIVTVIFWYLIMTPPGTHYCECFSFSTLLSYKRSASCLYIIIIWCLLKLLYCFSFQDRFCGLELLDFLLFVKAMQCNFRWKQ